MTLYNTKYHSVDLSQYKFLVTGGAGFIGSNIVEYLLKFNAGHVRVLDNLSNGYYDNISEFVGLPNFEFIEGDIRDLETCYKVVEGIDFISHQAALGSVPRSIKDPICSNDVNVNGFLNILVAAKETKSVKRLLYAASSSTYGDSDRIPKIEGEEGRPLSPYAVTKLVNELYAEVFSKVYGFHSIGLRYFNVFGPKQNPNNPYAAVIPIFCKNIINGTTVKIFGDGSTSRDFTFIENVVQANIRAMLNSSHENKCSTNSSATPELKNIEKHEVFNVACGSQISLNGVVECLKRISGNNSVDVECMPERPGDVRHSKASISKLKAFCNYEPIFDFEQGLNIVYHWYKNTPVKNS